MNDTQVWIEGADGVLGSCQGASTENCYACPLSFTSSTQLFSKILSHLFILRAQCIICTKKCVRNAICVTSRPREVKALIFVHHCIRQTLKYISKFDNETPKHVRRQMVCMETSVYAAHWHDILARVNTTSNKLQHVDE